LAEDDRQHSNRAVCYRRIPNAAAPAPSRTRFAQMSRAPCRMAICAGKLDFEKKPLPRGLIRLGLLQS
jgi:hypothetical protein